MLKLKFEIRITIIYLIIGSLWIIFSDRFVSHLTSDIYVLSELQTYKGWFYVIITSILFFGIVTDKVKLTQIIYNLLNNANKFTSSGHIHFGYKLKDTILEFYVEDTGIGIDNEEHNTIFQRFFKSGKNGAKLYDGVGLGLAICKGNVEILGGKIWLKSELNSGSTFYFTIPYKTPSFRG